MKLASVRNARTQFVGVWSLESFTERLEAAEISSAPLGENPKGLLIYTADGFVSAQLMRANRDLLQLDPWEPTTSAAALHMADDYIAYCGRYEINEDKTEVIHLPLVALLPNLIHEEQHRSFRFKDQKLILVTMRKRRSGDVAESTLQWNRCSVEPRATAAW